MSTGARDSYGSRSRFLGKRKLKQLTLIPVSSGCANPRESPPFIQNLAAVMVKRARRQRRRDAVRNHWAVC